MTALPPTSAAPCASAAPSAASSAPASAARRRFDRHLFASNASAYNSAWETYGWTRGLDRIRAGRLEERVPWGAELHESPCPPVLVHGGDDAPTARGPLQGAFGVPEAFLPLDGRLGYCLSGVVRPTDAGTHLRRPRTATHTVLFDDVLFREIDGFPQGLHQALHATPNRELPEAPWFAQFRRSSPSVPSPMPELAPPLGTAHFRRARLREVERLARTATARSLPAARDALEGVYQAAGRLLEEERPTPHGAGPLVPVAWPEPGDCLLLRLAWLSLPLTDRRRVYYSMLDLRGRYPAPCLVPRDHPAFADGAPAQSDGPDGAACPERLKAWAALVLERPADYARASARIDARGMSLFAPESAAYFVHSRPARLGAVDVAARARLEALGPARWRGLGRLAAADLTAWPADPLPGWARAVVADPRLGENPRFCDGLVRGLRGRAMGPEAAKLALWAGVRAGGRAAGVALVVTALGALAEEGAEAGVLGDAVRQLRERDGERAGVELTRIAAGLLDSLDRADDVPDLIDAAGHPDPIDVGLASDLARAFVARAERAGPAWRPLLRRVWAGTAAREATAGTCSRSAPGPGPLHRLAWAERRLWGETALAALATERRTGARALARRLMEAEPGPPLSVYLALRAALAKGAAA